jgi:hypothetical protein
MGVKQIFVEDLREEFVRDFVAVMEAVRLALPDAFPHKYGAQNDLLEIYGLMPHQIDRRKRLPGAER